MKTALISIFLLTLPFAGKGQKTETTYYRDVYSGEEVAPDKAKYSKTVTEENGIVTTIVKNLKNGKIDHSDAWRGDEPVGVWIGRTGRGSEERDYNFELVYEERKCSNPESLQGVNNFFADNTAVSYKAPILEERTDIMHFLVRYLRYPAKARRNGIQGKVYIAFTITKEGKVQDIVVTQGVHILLDKESVRLLRQMKLVSPPMLNDEPIEICLNYPISFKLK
jgi:TonB family protein